MQRNTSNFRYPVIFALDMPWPEARIWVERLGTEIWGYKVGSALFTKEGPPVLEYLKQQGVRVFLDLKFHDIPQTVELAVKSAFDLGADLVSVHAACGRETLSRVSRLQSDSQSLLAISVLTSLDENDLRGLGLEGNVMDQMLRLTSLALDCGFHGLVCSPNEVVRLRSTHPSAQIVCPGIRLNGPEDDQKRVSNPKTALESGANLLVLGRALAQAENWEEEWQKIRSSMAETY